MPTDTKRTLQKYLLLIALLLAAPPAFAANGKVTMDTHTFYITFVDTTVSFKEVLHLEYSDTGKQRKAIIKTLNDTALKADSILLIDSLDYRDFKTQINKIALKHSTGHTLSENSLWEIYEWILAQAYGNSAQPLSGRLHFAGAVQYFVFSDGNEDLNKQDDNASSQAYRQRIRKTDTLLDKQAYYTSQVNLLNDQIANDSAKRAADVLQQGVNKNDIQKFKDYINDFVNNGPAAIKPTNPRILPFLNEKQLADKTTAYNLIATESKAISGFLKNISIANIGQYNKAYAAIAPQLSVDKIPLDTLRQLSEFFSSAPPPTDKIIIVNKIKDLGVEKMMENTVAELQQRYKSEVNSLLEKAEKSFEKMLVEQDADLKKHSDSLRDDISNANRQIAAFRKNLGAKNIGNILNVQLQFERGFVENVKVIVDVDNEPTIFENTMAIGFTSKYNLALLRGQRLFGRNTGLHIWLADVLRMYDNELDNYTRDYSPADTVISIDPNATPRVFVYKSQFVNLFEAKAYTDLEGLSNQQPNGILQIEVSRRLNINTTRYGRTPNVNYGWGNYLYVFGSLNKIEKNQRYLPLHNSDLVVNNTLASPSYATSLDFLKYRNITAGAEVNAFTVDFPNMKSTITLDLGAQYGHVPLIDSTRFINGTGGLTATKDTLHLDASLVTLYPKLMLQIFPERRLGLSFSYQPQHTRFFSNNQFRQIASYAKSDVSGLAQEPASRWSHMFEALVKIEINKTTASYAFFRSRFFWQQGDVNTFFPQMQVGYSYNLNIVKALNK